MILWLTTLLEYALYVILQFPTFDGAMSLQLVGMFKRDTVMHASVSLESIWTKLSFAIIIMGKGV